VSARVVRSSRGRRRSGHFFRTDYGSSRAGGGAVSGRGRATRRESAGTMSEEIIEHEAFRF